MFPQQYNIAYIRINDFIGIEIYKFLQILSENIYVKHNLESVIISAFDSVTNHDISLILKAKSLGFKKCTLKYFDEENEFSL